MSYHRYAPSNQPLFIRVFLALIAMVCASFAQAAPPPGTIYDVKFGPDLDLPHFVGAYELDPDWVTQEQMAKLAAAKVYTICYVSIGTLENAREDAALFPPEIVGNIYADWPNERFLDVRALDILLPLMEARFARCRDLGFDAIDADNMDIYDQETGFALRDTDMLRYILALAKIAHELGLDFPQKNTPSLTGQLVDVVDFAITESCFLYGWCDEMLPYIAKEKPVFNIEYRGMLADFKAACLRARSMGISLIMQDRIISDHTQFCLAPE